jgi:hypothetical protein
MSNGISVAAGITRAAQAVGVNAIPAAGVIGAWWSSGTALALYWIEGALVIGLMAARIALHRRWTRKAGHGHAAQFKARSRRGRHATPRAGSFLGSYLLVAIPFTLAHGLFLGLLLFMIAQNRPDLGVVVEAGALRTGAIAMLAFLAVGFAADLAFLAQQPFRWIERLTERSLGRVVVMHLVIIFGVMGLALTDSPMWLIGGFAGLKALVELGAFLPEKELGPQPPAWLRWMNRLPAKDGETFDTYWRRTEASERSRREANERVLGAA